MMRLKARFLVVVCVLSLVMPVFARQTLACGHDSFYMGLGYEQIFMYTPEGQYSGAGANLGRITFSPGFGGLLILGYDFCGSRWGIQMPFEFTRQRLNHFEWVNQFGSTLEGVLHLVEWGNGIDIHIVGGVGWSYLTEGSAKNRTSSTGLTVDVGPGFSYYFSRTDKVSAALSFEVPFRLINYFNDRLSKNGTTIVAVPLRLMLQVGF